MSSHVPILETARLLKRTLSRCPQCHAQCPAEVWKIAQKVFLRRVCAAHGLVEVCIASDAKFYWLSKGSGANAACGGGKCCSADNTRFGTLGRNAIPAADAGVHEKLSTCLALIEIVHSCNLSCPTCYADASNAGGRVDAVPVEDLKARIQGVIDRKGRIEILQLSGGEPTLHPQFFELLSWLQDNPGIDYILLNTNGVRIAADRTFAENLQSSFRYGKFQLYLQFDGIQEDGQQWLRGADLRAMREQALERCRAAKIPVTLAMTVTPGNLGFLWDTVEFGLRWPNIRGVSFQPLFASGRIPLPGDSFRRINTADVITAIVEQSQGKLRYDDFTPLPCGDPNCATIGYLLKTGDRIRSISDFVDFTKVQDFLSTRIRYKLEDLIECGCESEPLGALLKELEMDETHTFRLFIKPFMDAWTWDEDRIDRCCTHVIRPDGALDSFCRYYSGFPDRMLAKC